jgi:Concanavalin A-like lectin/glucanases superfamily
VLGNWNASSAFSGGDPLDKWSRARITLEDDVTGSVRQGIYYLQRPNLNWYGKSKFTQVSFAFVDGAGLMAALNLPRMDPPGAQSLSEVIDYDQPDLMYALNERSGNKMVQHVKRKRKRKKGESRKHYRQHGFRHWKALETIAELQGSSGPAGTYKNAPELGQPSLIPGTDETCVKFVRANQTYGRIVPEDMDDILSVPFSLEAWVKPITRPDAAIIAGPEGTGTGAAIWGLYSTSTLVTFAIPDGLGFTDVSFAYVLPTTQATHIVGTVDFAGNVKLYIDGVEVASGGPTAGPITPTGNAIYIGNDGVDLSSSGFNGYIQYASPWYPEDLSAERVFAHYVAGALRGRPVESVGARIAALADHPFWDTDLIQTTGPDVQPVFLYGQSPVEEIDAAAECEIPDSHYFHNGDGAPVYLAADFRSAPPYDTVAAFLSNDPADDAVVFDDALVDWDDELYNIVPVSIDGGTEIELRDQDSIDLRLEHTFSGGTGLLLNDSADAEDLGQRILDAYSGAPATRIFSVDLHGVEDTARPHIFQRDIGDLVRVKKRADSGPDHDVTATLLGWRKRYEQGQVTCRWLLSRPRS